jgi:ketosteroid isomerase-like protein
MKLRAGGRIFGALMVIVALIAPGCGQAADPVTAPDDQIDRLLHDYLALYTKDTLDAWRGLFHPDFVAAFTNPDGTTTSRTLDEFVTRQRNYFATGRAISEELEEIKVERQGPLASVRARFILHDGDTAKPGRLMMLLIRERDRYLIQSLVFTYQP